MESQLDYHTAKALLAWQIDLGADEAIGDTPVNRYEVPAAAPVVAVKAAPVAAPKAAKPTVFAPVEGPDPVAAAKAAAQAAPDLDALRASLGAFELCELRRGARNMVFSDGAAHSKIMIIGEAPGRDDDRAGRPFVGETGKLLDRMLAAIGLGRSGDDPAKSVYLTNVVPWRPPQDRDPSTQEIAMMKPFIERHIELADPKIVVLFGDVACEAALGKKGVKRMRGSWGEVLGRPALTMMSPSYLLRNPAFKREAWADLLSLSSRLKELA